MKRILSFILGVVLALNMISTSVIAYMNEEMKSNMTNSEKSNQFSYYKEDLNDDGVVDYEDYDLLVAEYNTTSSSPNWNPRYDINNDGIVDLFDLILMDKKITEIQTNIDVEMPYGNLFIVGEEFKVNARLTASNSPIIPKITISNNMMKVEEKENGTFLVAVSPGKGEIIFDYEGTEIIKPFEVKTRDELVKEIKDKQTEYVKQKIEIITRAEIIEVDGVQAAKIIWNNEFVTSYSIHRRELDSIDEENIKNNVEFVDRTEKESEFKLIKEGTKENRFIDKDISGKGGVYRIIVQTISGEEKVLKSIPILIGDKKDSESELSQPLLNSSEKILGGELGDGQHIVGNEIFWNTGYVSPIEDSHNSGIQDKYVLTELSYYDSKDYLGISDYKYLFRINIPDNVDIIKLEERGDGNFQSSMNFSTHTTCYMRLSNGSIRSKDMGSTDKLATFFKSRPHLESGYFKIIKSTIPIETPLGMIEPISGNEIEISNELEIVGAFLHGAFDGIMEEIVGLVEAISTPIETLKNLYQLISILNKPITSPEYMELTMSISMSIIDWIQELSDANDKDKAYKIGKLLGSVVLELIGTKGMTKFKKLADAGQISRAIGKLIDGEKVEDVLSFLNKVDEALVAVINRLKGLGATDELISQIQKAEGLDGLDRLEKLLHRYFSCDDIAILSKYGISTAEYEAKGINYSSVAENISRMLNTSESYVEIYRAVGIEEFEDIMSSGIFRPSPSGFDSKQFGFSMDEILNLSNNFPDSVAIFKAKITKEVFIKLDFNPVDTAILKSGNTTVQGDVLKIFNDALLEVKQVY